MTAAMTFRPRFSLRTLLVLIAIYAALFFRRQYPINWSHERRNSIDRTSKHPRQPFDPVIVFFYAPTNSVPLSLRIWTGEDFRVAHVRFYLDRLSLDEVHWIDDFRRLFPEAGVTAKTAAEWRREEF